MVEEVAELDSTERIDANTSPMSVRSLSNQIASGKLDCVKLMQATLSRIEEIQPRLNPFILLKDHDELMAQASLAAAEAERGEIRGWLHGIPTAVKDLVNVQNFPTTHGGVFSPTTTAVQQQSDPHIQRLEAAGAIVIGKTNVPELGLGSHTFNPTYGITRNAWGDHSRSAGGSSGGAAVAIATNCLAFADGTDMGGSLRNPAGWNHVYSIRPTAGLLSPPDEVPYPLPFPLSTPGPMARNVEDLGLLLETMAGPDVWSYERSLANSEKRKVLWLGDWGGHLPMENGILQLCRESLELHLPDTYSVQDAAPQNLFPLGELWKSWVVIRSVVISKHAESLSSTAKNWSQTKEELQWELRNGSSASAELISKSCSTVAAFCDWLQDSVWERGFGAIALPSAQVWPFPVEQEYPAEIEGVKLQTYHEWMKAMIFVTLGGLPCVTVPAGFGQLGLPIGIQIASARRKDAELLHIAESYESNFVKRIGEKSSH